jgi:prolyl-tRNA synthetase
MVPAESGEDIYLSARAALSVTVRGRLGKALSFLRRGASKTELRGIGHIFKSERNSARRLKHSSWTPLGSKTNIMGCYGLGYSLPAAVIEQNQDKEG